MSQYVHAVTHFAFPLYSYTIRTRANLYSNDQSVVETATDAAATAASTVTAAATTMQDSVFSMFGGGAKKEKVDSSLRIDLFFWFRQ